MEKEKGEMELKGMPLVVSDRVAPAKFYLLLLPCLFTILFTYPLSRLRPLVAPCDLRGPDEILDDICRPVDTESHPANTSVVVDASYVIVY